MNCKYCGNPLSESAIERGNTHCTNCGNKLLLIRKFIETCDELKRIINYDEILRRRERRSEKYCTTLP